MRGSHDLTKEKLLTIAQAAQRVPGGCGQSTLWRWLATGARGVRLESVLIGGRRYTSEEAITRFVAAVTAAGRTTPPPRKQSA